MNSICWYWRILQLYLDEEYKTKLYGQIFTPAVKWQAYSLHHVDLRSSDGTHAVLSRKKKKKKNRSVSKQTSYTKYISHT